MSGLTNTISNTYCSNSIVSGLGNSINDNSNGNHQIITGQSNIISMSSYHQFIGGGISNMICQQVECHNMILGGNCNCIVNTSGGLLPDCNIILGGFINCIDEGIYQIYAGYNICSIAGGLCNFFHVKNLYFPSGLPGAAPVATGIVWNNGGVLNIT
jgi:hypothetical protein